MRSEEEVRQIFLKSQVSSLRPRKVPHQGIEPRLAVPKTAVLSGTLARHQYPDLDLNQGLDLRRVQCIPLHHRDVTSKHPGLDSNQD